MTTSATALRRRVELVNLDEHPPVPFRFVFQLPHKLAPSYIRDGFRQCVVLYHILNRKTLDADDLVFADDLCRELVLIVTPSISYPGMDTSHFQLSLPTVLTPFFLLGMPSLSFSQLLFIFGKELRIVVDVTIRGDDHRFQAQVKPDLLIDDWQMLDIFFYQERNKVAMGTIFGNGDRCGFATFGQGTAPVDIQGCIHLSKREVGSIPGKSVRGIGSRLHAMLFLESGILSSALQEVAEGTVQMPQSLLQGNTRYLTEPSRRCLLFEVSQHDCQLMVGKAFAMLEESIGPVSQCPIVDKAT